MTFNFSLFDVATAQEVPCVLQCVQCVFMDLPVSCFVSQSSSLTVLSFLYHMMASLDMMAIGAF